MLVIVDYNAGNPASIKNMLRKVGADSEISSEAKVVGKATKLILPGVGAFDHGMRELTNSGLKPVLEEKVVHQKVPVLGICLGLHLMTRRSQEGKLEGLGWVDADTIRFEPQSMSRDFRARIPNMGWCYVATAKKSRLFENMYENPRFYFVHSYHLAPCRDEDVLVTAEYGYSFIAGIERANVMGVQFHPEKSHKFGMKLLENFVSLYP